MLYVKYSGKIPIKWRHDPDIKNKDGHTLSEISLILDMSKDGKNWEDKY